MDSRSLRGDPLNGDSRNFRRMLGYSALFHLAMLVGVMVVSILWTSRPLASPVYEVDLISLPQAKPAPVKKPKPPEAVKKKAPVKKVAPPKPPPPKPIPAPVALVPVKPKPAQPEPKPEPVVPEERPPVETVEEPAPHDPLANLPAPEVQIQAQVEIPDFEYPYYLELIRRKIGRHWAPPRLNSGAEIREAVIEFQLFSKGKITGIRISKSSGNAFFDQAALRAIYQANPLPPLPQGVKKETLKIKLQFVLGRKG